MRLFSPKLLNSSISIKKNFIYNTISQLVSILVPFITLPYVTRVLSADDIGINSYTNSIVQYFVLFGTFGLSSYGNRSIAYVSENIIKRSETFWELFFFGQITTIVSYLIFSVSIIYNNSYTDVFFAQSITIIAGGLDISWFFIGIEKFKKVVIRNIFVKIIGTILIFLFVNSSDDLIIYILILSVTQLMGQIIVWISLPGYICLIKLNQLNIKQHIIPNIKIFVPTIAIQLYVQIDKTMIGWFVDKAQVGFYDIAEKITKMPLVIVTSLGTVMMPRIAYCYSKDDMESIKKYIDKTFKVQSYLAFVICFGLIACSKNFVNWFLSSDYQIVGTLISMLSFVIIAIAWGHVVGNQLLISLKMENKYTIAVFAGVFVNVIANLFLIPKYQAMGAVIATLIGEYTVSILEILFTLKYLNFLSIISELWKYLFSSIVMFIVLVGLNLFHIDGVFLTILQLLLGGGVYCICLIILKSKINAEILSLVLHRVRILEAIMHK
jgi:O-antigen/teichoic acid export membrane protein